MGEDIDAPISDTHLGYLVVRAKRDQADYGPDDEDSRWTLQLAARLSAAEAQGEAMADLLYWGGAVFEPEGRYKHALHKANVEPDIIFDRWMDDVDELRCAFDRARRALEGAKGV